jgi:trehalose 6-phosphate synthase
MSDPPTRDGPGFNTDDYLGPAETSSEPPTSRPIVVAANRLPVMRDGDGWTASPGGLVRALVPMLRDSGGMWVGWTGNADDAPEPFNVDGVELHPIAISHDEVERYYEGFSNDTLWPLYHDALRESTYRADNWEAYVRVNERFADKIAEIAPSNAIVWVHDYHLQLVPSMLRDRRDDVVIGFFLHIPFPPTELFNRLPWRDQILRGLLGCDLIGFQRSSNASNFITASRRIVGTRVEMNDADVVIHHDQRCHVGAFPISIDVEEFEELAAGRATRRVYSLNRTRLGEPEVILLGVDRLDYTKGIGLRLKAYKSLLDDGSLDPERVVMVQVATPTREAVEHYQDERNEIERLVGEINGEHSRLGYPAVHYLYRSLPLEELVPLYRTGDVMLVTPFRDGMNLVAKEFVATRLDNDGVLVLSEFTGAADELTEAVLVNPHDRAALRAAIMTAVEMHRHERRERMSRLREIVRRSDVKGWAERFLRQLVATIDGTKRPDHLNGEDATQPVSGSTGG